ncbi:winged helix-turn-helix transcriptional regulator [Enterovirga aerilata]|uniref:Transcriptional regulator n=1 Tax=Enterovirga aerilata TaxID=2730920 RepID=A0A849IES3_9HYPH|nr:helix-turn-helix domain-containing protein [Enterovirga sp. DB1703]NNM74725.1 transcriptional regulator [Enterovirga sp. DB1703]
MKSEKITESRVIPKRHYDDACGAAHALDLVGERWALLVMRELMLGPKRFGELRADLPGISANVLTQRLEGLEKAGILVRRKLPPPASVQVYELTPWGYESEPIFQALGRWAARSPTHDPSLPLSATSLFLSFRTMFDPSRAQAFSARIGFRFGETDYLVTVTENGVEVARGTVSGAQAIVTGTPPAVAGAVYGGVPLDALIGSGALAIEGDRALFERFATLFPLPPKVEAA